MSIEESETEDEIQEESSIVSLVILSEEKQNFQSLACSSIHWHTLIDYQYRHIFA